MKRILFLLLLLLSGCNYIEIDGKLVQLEVARTDDEQAVGLMYRTELCGYCGMLFVFENEDRHIFWMKNTLIPLDMVFIDSNMTVVDVLHAEPCMKDPCSYYIPRDDALYVLETNQGMFNETLIGEKVAMYMG